MSGNSTWLRDLQDAEILAKQCRTELAVLAEELEMVGLSVLANRVSSKARCLGAVTELVERGYSKKWHEDLKLAQALATLGKPVQERHRRLPRWISNFASKHFSTK